MTLEGLYQSLKAIGYPVFYSHPTVNDHNPPPTPPYLTYLFSYSNDIIADNVNYIDVSQMQIELYTKIKDPSVENNVQDKLKELELPYYKHETYLDSENLFQIIYEIQLIGA